MTKLIKYLPYILILLAFFLGQFLGTQDKSGEELLKQRFEQEQQRDRDSISALLHKLAVRDRETATIRKEMIQRIAEKDSALKAERMVSTYFQKLNEKINLSRTGIPALDSLRAELRGTLHSD